MYQLKCKSIALAVEARAFRQQEAREKRLFHVQARDDAHRAGDHDGALRHDRRVKSLIGLKSNPQKMSDSELAADTARIAKWRKRAEVGKAKAKRSLDVFNGIRNHRLMKIRTEARVTLLAYGFLSGLSYRDMEPFSWTQPQWERVEILALRYRGSADEQAVKQRFAQWIEEALGGVEPKWKPTVVPGSVKDSSFDPAWVEMQRTRNAT